MTLSIDDPEYWRQADRAELEAQTSAATRTGAVNARAVGLARAELVRRDGEYAEQQEQSRRDYEDRREADRREFEIKRFELEGRRLFRSTRATRTACEKPEQAGASQSAYAARKRVRKSAFPELRDACLRLGGQLTAPFLSLDNRIDNFAAQTMPAQAAGGLRYQIGSNERLFEELDEIENAAKSLRDEASTAIKRCLDELASLSP